MRSADVFGFTCLRIAYVRSSSKITHIDMLRINE